MPEWLIDGKPWSQVCPNPAKTKNGWDESRNPNWQVPGNKTVRLTLFWARNFVLVPGRWEAQVQTAREMLAQHGVGLHVYPETRIPEHVIGYNGMEDVIPDSGEKYNLIRWEASLVFDDQNPEHYNRAFSAESGMRGKSRLPIIFCEFEGIAGGRCVMTQREDRGMIRGQTPWPNFCLVSGAKISKRALIHEIGHAASNLAGHTDDQTGTPLHCTHFMNPGVPGPFMWRFYLEYFLTAPFSE